jgi:integrase
LRVSSTGRKAWTYFYRLQNGKIIQRRMTVGVYPAMTVEQAHEAWRKAFDLVQAGRDPAATPDKLPALSFESVFEEWIKRDQSGNKSADRVEQRIRAHCLPAWKHRPITEIDRRAALAVVDDITDSGRPVLARRVFSHLHRLFVWAVGRGIIEVNPLQHAERPGAEVSRDRVLSDEELSKVWLAAEQLTGAYRPYRDALRLLILTGARKMEITALRWEEIRDGAIHLEGERTKNGKPHVIPLSAAARSIVAGIEQTSGYVFPVKGGTYLHNWGAAKEKLDAACGVTGWTIHDLRRTVATGLQRHGVPLPVTESVLGHQGGSRSGIVGIYQRHDYAPEKASALEAWGAHVMALVEGSERGKVLSYVARESCV